MSGLITFLGDVFLPAPVRVAASLEGHLVYNLEAPITLERVGWPATVNLRCEAHHAAATFGRQPLAVCLANNHVMDFREQGLRDTLATLDAAGVHAFGAGTLAENCRNPILLDVDGVAVALLGYACATSHPVFASLSHPGAAPLDIERIARDLDAAQRAGARWRVVHLHWGVEELALPRLEDVALARRVVEQGADLVIGHHAHCVQPAELHRGKWIFYGLGNTIFPDVDVPSDFSEAGEPRGRFVKLQNYWNARGLAVRFDVHSGAVTPHGTHFDGTTLRDSTTPLRVFAPEDTDPRRYAPRFRRAFFAASIRNKVVNYARRPKLPRLRHLRSLVAILREARGG